MKLDILDVAIIIIALCAVSLPVFLIFTYGETSVIYGVDEDISIAIIDDGFNNIMIFGDEKYEEIRVRHYNSGGFYMKSLPDIMVFAHPREGQYELVIFAQGEVYRITGKIGVLSDLSQKSSVGADISKWDIPTQGRTDHTPPAKTVDGHDPDSLDIIFSVPKSVQWMNNLKFDFTAIDTQIVSNEDQRLSNVDVYTTITNPIGEIVGTWNGTTGGFGTFGDEYYIEDNQMLGKYTFEVSAEKEDYNLITKMISFFVLPLNSDSSAKCPSGYFYNYTSIICQEECADNYFYNYTSIMCQEECIDDYFYNYTSIQCEEEVI